MMLFLVFIASLISFAFYYHKDIWAISDFSRAYFLFSARETPMATILMFSLPLFVAIPHADINFVEENIKCQLFMKVKKDIYYISKVITTFMVGFFMVASFLILIYVFMWVMLKSNTTYFPKQSFFFPNDPENAGIVFARIYFNFPVLYNLLYIALVSIYGGFLAVIAYCFSLLIKSKPFVYLSSFFVSVFCVVVPMLFRNGIAVWAPNNIYLPFPLMASYPGIFSIPLGMLFWFILFSIFILIVVSHKIKVEE
jgi:hypothetical protein